jgi:hypothetical protein
MPRYALASIGFVAAASLVLAGCGGGNESATTASDTTTTDADTTTAAEAAHTNADWATIASDADSYKGDSVKLVGRVFSIERTADGLGLQVWMDPKNIDLNTAVAYYGDPAFQVAEDDYVRVIGTVGGTVEGKNALGRKLTIPLVVADSVEIVGALAAALPAYTTYGREASTEGGVRMIVMKIEAAPDETRVYVRVNNLSAADFSFYSSAKLVANGRSIKPSYGGDYPEPASNVAAHSRTSGVILFEKIPRDAVLRLILDGFSDRSEVFGPDRLFWTFTWKG